MYVYIYAYKYDGYIYIYIYIYYTYIYIVMYVCKASNKNVNKPNPAFLTQEMDASVRRHLMFCERAGIPKAPKNHQFIHMLLRS